MVFIKLLLKFLIGLLWNNDEYHLNSKNFNPVRLVVITLIIVYSVAVTVRLMEYRRVIEEHCKVCVIEVDE